MSHFAVIAPPYPSHFAAFQAVAGELIERGHRVTFVHQPETRRWISDPRIGFIGIGEQLRPVGSLDSALRLAADPAGPLGLRRLIQHLADTSALLCEALPAVLADGHIDALLCDQMEPAGALMAEACGLPYISVACALPINREPGVPLPVIPFGHGLHPRWYEGSERVHDWLMRPVQRVLQNACRTHGLTPRAGAHEWLSPLAQISQTLTAFDFPRQQLPAHFHAVGPLRSQSTAAPFAWQPSARRPFVFASLGTLQGHRFDVFLRIAQACQALDVQLLIAHCGGLRPEQCERLLQQGASHVTAFAPQDWAVRLADVVVTHGGLNTVLDAVSARTPVLVMPIAFDQHGVAARVRHHGLGKVLKRGASASCIADALAGLLASPWAASNALQNELAVCGGATAAANLIETAVRSGRPVAREAVHA